MGKVVSINTMALKPGVTEAELIDYLDHAQYTVPGQTIFFAKDDD